jgi:hypothetical protein
MKTAAIIVGFVAMAVLVLSYQQKTRKWILICNITARSLFILQYILLFAFEGMALDLVGVIGSVLAQQKDKPFVKKHQRAVVIGVNVLIVAVGVAMYRNLFSLLPLVAVLLQIDALWCSKEKHVRLLSLIAVPWWVVYNAYCSAWGSVAGDLMSLVSLVTAMLRYDLKKK